MSEETAPYGTGAPQAAAPVKKVRTHHLREMKERGEKFTMLTAVRHVHRRDLRRGRHRRPARRRLRLQQRLRQRDLAARHRRRAAPAHPRRHPLGAAARWSSATCRSARYQASPEQAYLTAVRFMKEAGAHASSSRAAPRWRRRSSSSPAAASR